MKEIVDRILEGQFEYENGTLRLSENRIEISLYPGETVEGSFVIEGDPGRYTEGYLYSSDVRMELLRDHFVGTGETIGYVFSSEGMDEGDVINGNITVVSNQGEYKLPFSVMVSYRVIGSSVGHVRNLFHFANLAKSDFDEAVRVFYDPAFPKILTGTDAAYLELYKGLSTRPMDQRSVEEFLVGVHKKQKATYIIDEDKLHIADPKTDATYKLIITRNGWGYTRLQVETEGDFLWTEKDVLYSGDFDGNRGEVVFQIVTKRLHDGRNFGALKFTESGKTVVLPVEVDQRTETKVVPEHQRNRKQYMAKLLRYFLAYRTKQMDRATWRTGSSGILTEMNREDEQDPLPKLYMVQLRITENKSNEAGWLLDQARINILQSKDRDPSLWCYYLYLTTLLRPEPDYVAQVKAEVEGYCQRNPENWKLGWFLLFLSGDLNSSLSARWMFLHQMLEKGCNSPLIYVEAWLMIQTEPSLLMEVGECEARVLLFAARYELLTEEVIEQLHYLLPRSTVDFSKRYEILKAAYVKTEDVTTLTDICSLLIEEDRRDADSFAWYEKGVELNLRINKLYEYYVYSLDLEKKNHLPQVLFMYFAFDNMLDYQHTAYLYADLYRRREELSQIYQSHKDTLSKFVLEQLRRGRIDGNLAYLYQETISVSNLDEELRGNLALLLFAHRVKVEDERAAGIVVLQPWMEKEKIYPVKNGEAVVVLFEEDVTFLLEDADGDRYVPEEPLRPLPFFKGNRLEKELAGSDFKSLGLQLHQCNPRQEEVVIRPDNAERYRTIAFSDNIESARREQVRLRLLQFDEKSGWSPLSEEMLSACDPEGMDAEGRKILLGLYASHDHLQDALRMIRRYGYQKADPKALHRVAVSWIQWELERTEPFGMAEKQEKQLEVISGGIGDTRPLTAVQTLARDPLMPSLFEQTDLGATQPLDPVDPDKTLPLPDLSDPEEDRKPSDPLLLYLCFEAFKKDRSDPVILQYLVDHYAGPARDLRDIWKDALGDLPSVRELSQQLIIQMLYTGFFVGEKMAIFASYVNEKPDPAVERAFLCQCSYDYFVKDKLTEEELFRYMEHDMDRGEDPDLICKLAYAKYYGEHPAAIRKKDPSYLERILKDLLLQDMYLPCFSAFLEMFDFLEEYRDKTVIEYKAHPDSVVQIRYIIGRKNDDTPEEYHSRNMKSIFGGVCTAEFVLFFGEKLMYYISEERNNVQELTESGSISHSEMHNKAQSSRFGILNDIMISETLQDYDTMNDMMDQYIRTEHLQERLFSL